jgi:PAS domain S-box-containing protein/TyrR family helix-turn-helix protein
MSEVSVTDSIIDALPIAWMAIDADMTVRYVNRYAQSLFPPEVSVAPGTPIADILPDLEQHVRTSFETGAVIRGVCIGSDKRELIAHIATLDPGRPGPAAVVAMEAVQDLERIAQKFDSYQLLTTQLEAVFQSSHDGLWLLDKAGKVLNINPAAERLMGVRAKDVIGKNIKYLVKKRLLNDAVSPKVLELKRTVNMVQYVSKTDKSILATGTPVLDENGDISMVVVNDRDMTELNRVSEKLTETQQVLSKNRDQLAEISMAELKENRIVVENRKMRAVLTTARKLGKMGASNILIQGESGTGKGLVAKFIHHVAAKKKRPFITINCAAIPETLLEAELFGYEKGAFTGADTRGKAGLFELANGGTLFLDEIGELPYQVQAKLLKCLEDYKIMRIGGLRPIKINCVIIAATNRDLETLVKQKAFRHDLFYRLNIFTLKVPPLRERPEDIFELAHVFLNQFNEQYGVNKKISSRAMDYLQSYRFSGNVRELINLIRQGVVLAESDYLDDIIQKSVIKTSTAENCLLPMDPEEPFQLKEKLQAVEKTIIENLYRQNLSTREMARRLGISQPSVINKLKRFKIGTS